MAEFMQQPAAAANAAATPEPEEEEEEEEEVAEQATPEDNLHEMRKVMWDHYMAGISGACWYHDDLGWDILDPQADAAHRRTGHQRAPPRPPPCPSPARRR